MAFIANMAPQSVYSYDRKKWAQHTGDWL